MNPPSFAGLPLAPPPESKERGPLIENRSDLVIIGGGIIGLAAAVGCGRRFPDWRLLVFEKEDRVGAHQSGHNSGVIHSGLYYRPGSLKAATCVEGAALMTAFCREHGLPLKICGKVVVARTEQELPALQELERRGAANGVPKLSLIGREQLREIEPHCAGVAALHLPGTAVTDYGEVTKKLAALVESGGGQVLTGAKVIGISQEASQIVVETTRGAFATQRLVNCAGLYSDRIASLAGERGARKPDALIIVPFRGEYYELASERWHLARGLIYPVPDPKFPFLGVHFTPRVGGGVEVGPNAVLAFHREGYRRGNFRLADAMTTLGYPGFWRMAAKYWRSGCAEYYRSFNKNAFVRDARHLLPDLRQSDLRPGGSGVRAQALDRAGKLVDDFRIHSMGNIIHVLNVPSPAATASLVIARHIAGLLG
ncbi:MAG: L-2-hydroxyglutarate oxidase [Acidobacteria bacterium]|nr:L-2-hydroxyglutarate oxidase [Acidobacteriota bacterium]